MVNLKYFICLIKAGLMCVMMESGGGGSVSESDDDAAYACA